MTLSTRQLVLIFVLLPSLAHSTAPLWAASASMPPTSEKALVEKSDGTGTLSRTGIEPTTSTSTSTEVSDNDNVVEILPEDFRPAFTRDTVIRLNEIVRRSHAVIGEFDQLKKSLSMAQSDGRFSDKSDDRTVDRSLTVIESLDARSKAALADMNTAVDDLTSSEEQYNSAVLAGMVIFVRDVEQEVSHFHQTWLTNGS